MHKPKGRTSAWVPPSDSLYRFKDESEEEEEQNYELVPHVRLGVMMRGTSEPAGAETELS